MKTPSLKTMAACAGIYFFAVAAGPALAVESVKVTVNGMVCAFCAQGIEKGLMGMPAAQLVFVDLKKKLVAIEAKDGQKLDPKKITAEIIDAGYDVVRLETVQLSVADIKAAAKAQK
ncbi:MAG: heavy-metal-associated domain-containing protein [Polaromonas sp.]|nr:MAG: heavy-metal-associated domain-containing protein [Polaromonas sp.]